MEHDHWTENSDQLAAYRSHVIQVTCSKHFCQCNHRMKILCAANSFTIRLADVLKRKFTFASLIL